MSAQYLYIWSSTPNCYLNYFVHDAYKKKKRNRFPLVSAGYQGISFEGYAMNVKKKVWVKNWACPSKWQLKFVSV